MLENLKPGVKVRGILPQQDITVVDVKWHGSTAVELFYKRPDGQPGTQLLYRRDEPSLEIVQTKRTWSFNADGDLFRLAAEAYRIHLAHLFDPVLAIHTSLIEPLPHQITGVYREMQPRQPLRFLLADDPGSGKTIMAGLLIKELMVRGDVQRCLICVPGNLATQWQDELWFKFQTRFEILTRDVYEAAVPLSQSPLDHFSNLPTLCYNTPVQGKERLVALASPRHDWGDGRPTAPISHTRTRPQPAGERIPL
jgi:hypothetical protein